MFHSFKSHPCIYVCIYLSDVNRERQLQDFLNNVNNFEKSSLNKIETKEKNVLPDVSCE